MFEGFVHPAFAGLAALAAVPLIIHLLNRQRHRPVRWAAMRFVLAAHRKTRRRVQIENLILLLLRMAAVALLAFAIARPFAAGDSALGNLTEKRRDLVLVLDGSASTGYTTGVETVFERIVQRAEDLVDEVAGSNSNRVYVILAGDHPRLLSWPSPAKASSVLATLSEPLDEELNLAAALGEVRRIAEEDAAGITRSSLAIHLLCDMQRNMFVITDDAVASKTESEPDPEADTAASQTAVGLYDQLSALEDMDLQVQVEDLGSESQTPPNLSIVDVALVGDPGNGSPLEVAVTVANHGNSPAPAVRVGLTVQGNRQPSQRVDVDGRGQTTAIYRLPAQMSGQVTLVADLEGDRLTADDQRASVVVLPKPVRLLLVNGAPSDRFAEDGVAFLELALGTPDFALGEDALNGSASPFQLTVCVPSSLSSGEIELTDFDVIWLADTSPLPETALLALEDRIAAGASLIVSVGAHFGQAGAAGRGLFRADGSGLLPAELGRRVSTASQEDYFQVADFDATHPSLTFYADESYQRLLTQVPIYEFLLARPSPGTQVLASLDDDGQSPLLLERSFAEGKSLLWTTSINPDWTPFPGLGKTFVPFVLELVRYAGAATVQLRDYPPGSSYQLEVNDFPRLPELIRPDDTRRALDGDPEDTAAGTWLLPALDPTDTRRSGLYRVAMDSGKEESFSILLNADEGDLERIGAQELNNLHPALLSSRPSDTDSTKREPKRQGEIWRWLAMLCLAALVAESLFGAWLGAKRRVV